MLNIKLEITPSFTEPVTLVVDLPVDHLDETPATLAIHSGHYRPVRLAGDEQTQQNPSRPIHRSHAQRLLELIARVQVPAYPKEASMGLDGTTYALEIREWFTAARYQWWQDVPPGWEPVGQVANFLIRDIARLKLNLDGPPYGEFNP